MRYPNLSLNTCVEIGNNKDTTNNEAGNRNRDLRVDSWVHEPSQST